MLDLDEDQLRFVRIFTPLSFDRADSMQRDGGRFVHYTSAETAFKIIQSRCVWMRNAMTMNDFSEVAYGKECLFPAYKSNEIGGRLKHFIDGIYNGFFEKFESIFNSWLPEFEQNTYLTSLSEHDKSEDELGRLSMWRAYGSKKWCRLGYKKHAIHVSD